MQQVNDIFTIIKSRRTIHRYLDQKVPFEEIQNAVLAAHHAPNHRLTFPWRFVHIGPQIRKIVDDASLKFQTAKSPLSEDALEIFKEKSIYPELLVVCQKRTNDLMQSKEDYAAVACAVQNLSLYLHSKGIGSKWSTGGLSQNPMAYQVLQINAQEEEIVGLIWIGYAANTPEINRPALSTIFRQTP
jgi:nitroreductase